jgi:anti-sigma factor RsiW
MSSIQDLMRKFLGIGGLHCRDCHKLLFDYAQGNLDAETAKKLEEHLGDCPPCLEYVETYRKTITACKNHCQKTAEMPPELKRKLQDFIAKNL